MDPVSIIASTIAISQAILSAYKAIEHIKGLPKAFREVNQNIPLVQETLELARLQLERVGLNEPSGKAVEPVISNCHKKFEALQNIFQEIDKGKDAKDWSALVSFYRTTVVPLGKAHRVEALMQDILKDLRMLAINQLFKTATQSQVAKLESAVQDLSNVDPSLPDADFETSVSNVTQHVAQGATGNQPVNVGPGTQTNRFGGYEFNTGGAPMHFGTDFMGKN